VTQQNAAMFEETNAATQSLTREAEGLMGSMARFHTGTAAVGRPASAPARPQPGLRVVAGGASFATRRGGEGGAPAAARPQPDADTWQEF
jgi:methyl-accepting chemotaxis protein